MILFRGRHWNNWFFVESIGSFLSALPETHEKRLWREILFHDSNNRYWSNNLSESANKKEDGKSQGPVEAGSSLVIYGNSYRAGWISSERRMCHAGRYVYIEAAVEKNCWKEEKTANNGH